MKQFFLDQGAPDSGPQARSGASPAPSPGRMALSVLLGSPHKVPLIIASNHQASHPLPGDLHLIFQAHTAGWSND